jgi:hypothetical protein
MSNVQRLETILAKIDRAEEALHNYLGLHDEGDQELKETILGLHSAKELIKTQFKEIQECKMNIAYQLNLPL